MKQLTSNAELIGAADDLEYGDLLDEILGDPPLTLRQLVHRLESSKSIAYWSQVLAGKKTNLATEQRNELRRAGGEPELPPTVLDVAANVISPNATIWQMDALPWQTTKAQAASGVIIFDAETYPHAPSTFEAALCNGVTRQEKERPPRTYPDLWSMPTKLLALAISEREDYG